MSYRYRRRTQSKRGLVSTISYLIRQFVLPNPFTNLLEDINKATIFNWIFGFVFIPLAFILTGTWYISGRDEKWVGSIGFLFNYFVLTEIFRFITKFIVNIYWSVVLFAVTCIVLYILESKVSSRNRINF